MKQLRSFCMSGLILAVVLVFAALPASALAPNLVTTKTDGLFCDTLEYTFELDEEAVGEWVAYDYISPGSTDVIDGYNPNKQSYTRNFGDSYAGNSIYPDGTAQKHNLYGSKLINWTKDYLIWNDDGDNQTVPAYKIREINNRTFMFVEWKSGDYQRTGEVPGYYVMVKVSDMPISDDTASNVDDPSAEENFMIESGVLAKYIGPGGVVTVPQGVSSIGILAFKDDLSITSVILPDGITAIKLGAFNGCDHLKSVVLPDSVREIEYAAFSSTGLTDLVLPDGVAEINNKALFGCHELKNITLSENLKVIGRYAFADCPKLKAIVIPKSVANIGEGALNAEGTDLTIYGTAGSYAETYAKKNNIPFKTGVPDASDFDAAPDLDDTASDWAREDIQDAIAKGIVPADLQNSYTAVITRQEFCRMAVKFVEYKTGKGIDDVLAERGLTRNPDIFTDTSDPDLLAAYALGITNGTSANTFSPNGQFSREQAAAMLMNACKAVGMDTEHAKAAGFSDMGGVAPWAVAGVSFCSENGIMKGTGDNQFNPRGTYTRQEAIVTFGRIS